MLVHASMSPLVSIGTLSTTQSRRRSVRCGLW